MIANIKVKFESDGTITLSYALPSGNEVEYRFSTVSGLLQYLKCHGLQPTINECVTV